MQPSPESSAFLVKVLADTFKRVGDYSMKADGITHSQMGVLTCLERSEDGTCSFKEIQHFMHVSQPTTVGLIQRLEQKGFIKTLSCATDQRMKLAMLTEAGREVLKAGQAHFEKTVSEMERGFTEEELEDLRGYLKRMITNLGAEADPELADCSHRKAFEEGKAE